jgi:hypothetical protein
MAKFEFVKTADGRFLVKVFNHKRWKRHGWAICDADHAWEAGINLGVYCEDVAPEYVPAEERAGLRSVAEYWGE